MHKLELSTHSRLITILYSATITVTNYDCCIPSDNYRWLCRYHIIYTQYTHIQWSSELKSLELLVELVEKNMTHYKHLCESKIACESRYVSFFGLPLEELVWGRYVPRSIYFHRLRGNYAQIALSLLIWKDNKTCKTCPM